MMTPKPMDVVIVGGSLTGLMHGIMLRSLGHNVHILERAGNKRESHMAGVCLAYDARRFFEKFDRVKSPFTLHIERVQTLENAGGVANYFKAPRAVTSWDAFYWRLRANYDGYASDFYPEPPPPEFEGAGRGIYDVRQNVTSVDVGDPKVTVHYQHLDTGEKKSVVVDFVIAADGPNSEHRLKYQPGNERLFSGYVAWRGTVPEKEVSESTREAFQENVTVSMTKVDHALIYIIPGENGSIKDGERHMNFLWYTNETAESMDRIMTDRDGHRHQYIVPAGKLKPESWQGLLDRSSELSEPHQEVLNKIKKPFLQSITDFVSPHASLASGKILLVGDSLSLFRPHTASSANQAAFDCLMMERLVKNEIDVQEWERCVLEFANIHWSRSVWYGENYQRPLLQALPSAFPYWWCAASEALKSVWGIGLSKLRY